MEFQVGDKVMLKVSPWKGVVCFGKREKLNPRYVGPFKVVARVGSIAYKLDLPEELSRFVEKPVEIMDREVKQLRNSRVSIVKVRWTLGEVLSSRGRGKINSRRSIHTSSPRPHRRQVPHYKPCGQGLFSGGRL
nr:putative reverse transcriptase domain, ribonuclease H-like domain, aspartic peptidase domain protein [Tanacetum cinerariifolium]